MNVSPKFSNLKKASLFVVSLIILIIIFALFLILERNSSSVFYVIQNNQTFSASLEKNSNDLNDYSDSRQLFTTQACDYFYFAFVLSIYKLETYKLVKSKMSIDEFDLRVDHVARFYKVKSLIDARCPSEHHVALSNLLQSFSDVFNTISSYKYINMGTVLKSQVFRDIVKIPTENIPIGKSFLSSMSIYKDNFYIFQHLTTTDFFKVDPNILNLESCSIYSQIDYLGKLITLNMNLSDAKEIKVLGFSNDTELKISGKRNDKILFEAPYISNYKDKKYCFYSITKNKVTSYYGKLNFDYIQTF